MGPHLSSFKIRHTLGLLRVVFQNTTESTILFPPTNEGGRYGCPMCPKYEP